MFKTIGNALAGLFSLAILGAIGLGILWCDIWIFNYWSWGAITAVYAVQFIFLWWLWEYANRYEAEPYVSDETPQRKNYWADVDASIARFERNVAEQKNESRYQAGIRDLKRKR